LILVITMAGCGSGVPNPGPARQGHAEAQRREVEVLQQARDDAVHMAVLAVQESQRERVRRERWQVAAYTAALAAIALLIVGVAVGSRSKPHGHHPYP
jgi:ferric-dicitrate binding protein FerR (iron transport regulator)